MVFIEEGKEIRIHAGEVLLLSPHRTNSSLPISGSAQMFFLHFQMVAAPRGITRETWHRTIQTALSDRSAGAMGRSFFLRSPIGLCRWMRPTREWDSIIRLLEAAIQEKESLSAFGNFSASLSIAQVLLLLSRSVLEGGPAPLLVGGGSASLRLIHKADSIIHYRCSEGLNVEDLASSLNVTPQHLIRTFQEHCGETPLARIHRIRMTKAQELLRHTTLSIKEISGMVGMPNVNHFCRFFRKQTGTNARKWRAQ